MPAPRFPIGSNVVVNPRGSCGRWTHVDSGLNHRGVATVIDVVFYKPDAHDVTVGCPKEGYYEYRLKWRTDEEHRPKYHIMEMFLFPANSKGAKTVKKFYEADIKHQKAVDRLNKKLNEAKEDLEEANDWLVKANRLIMEKPFILA